MSQPEYFETIRRRAADRWSQLEGDRDLAAPWHQLFKQVQSPRHVVSELLQNADDAGATEAAVTIEQDRFIFEHNGRDFTEADFASLCRFGFSNKRVLHTIGFRGIGFKSTFSLGSRVELHTPTLSVEFDRRRFTEPRPIRPEHQVPGWTRVSVVVEDERRRTELERNLTEWRRNPLSLLFFKNLRQVRFAGQEVCWQRKGPGPIAESEWMSLSGDSGQTVLHIRSEAEPFPADAVEEIRRERMLQNDEETDLPRCRVEIVLGRTGRLFVVLPTGVQTELPFACNAPFVQDPARMRIVDPSTSPTNRWLLERAGDLAARAMLAWLEQDHLSAAERAMAYELLPDQVQRDSSLEGQCHASAATAFRRRIHAQRVILTEGGTLVEWGQCVSLPSAMIGVWPAQQLSGLFDSQQRPVLSSAVTEAGRRKLVGAGAVEEITDEQVAAVLRGGRVPRPESWHQLLALWSYVAEVCRTSWTGLVASPVRIVPVEGCEDLLSPSEVVRLSDRRSLGSASDWAFLGRHLRFLDRGWARFLAEQRASAEDTDAASVSESISRAEALLARYRLADSSDADQIIDRAAASLFGQQTVSIADCVQLAQIAAALEVTAGRSFRYVTSDGRLRAPHEAVVDTDGDLEELLPEHTRRSALLHPQYYQAFASCTSHAWSEWIRSGRAGLGTFPAIEARKVRFHQRSAVEREMRLRGAKEPVQYHYRSNDCVISDWDFPDELWAHWHQLAEEGPRVWAEIAARILGQRADFWARKLSVSVVQVTRGGYERAITNEPLVPNWIRRLRETACLRDTRGECRVPAELLRRTPATEPLINLEPFVDSRHDCERTHQLLDVLGVRSTPTGPERMLDCLRSLAMSECAPPHEVDRWYERLDRMVPNCDTDDLQTIREAFRNERLILSSSGRWGTVASVAMSANEEDAPGALTVRPSVEHLALWRELGVADRPTIDRAIKWLRQLPIGTKLAADESGVVKALLGRHPVRVWEECGAWLNLAGEWVGIDTLEYALPAQAYPSWRTLNEVVKQKTADLQRVANEVAIAHPFNVLGNLDSIVEERFGREPVTSGSGSECRWIQTLGEMLARFECESEAETARVRSIAQRLAQTRWQNAPGLEVIPYIGGTPAGVARRTDVLWRGSKLYVEDLPLAKLAKRVPEEIARVFGVPAIRSALDFSFERSPEQVRAYLEENFQLAAADAASLGPASTPVDAVGIDPGAVADGGRRGDQCPAVATADVVGGIVDGLATDATLSGDRHVINEVVDDAAEDGAEHGGGDSEQGDFGSKARADQPTRRRPAVDIVERFALEMGFKRIDDRRYGHLDGSCIAKTFSDRFPWEHRAPSGEVTRYYWAKDHCLERAPLQLDADIWGLIDSHPDRYALILEGPDGGAVAVGGQELQDLLRQDALRIYPASYRLVRAA